MSRIFLIAPIAVACCIVGCGDDTTAETDVSFTVIQPRDVIVTTTAPLTWMAQQIAGDAVPVESLLPIGVNPAQWQPEPVGIATLQSAGLIVTNGAGLEKWVVKTTLPTSRLLDTTEGLAEPFIRYENVVIHKHGPGGDQSFEGVDPRTWIDPIIARHQASRIAEAASRSWPDHREMFETNLKVLHQQLDELDARYRSLAAKMKAVRIVSRQPAYNYLARRYQWDYHSFELEKGQQITAELLKQLPSPGQPDRRTIIFYPMKPIAPKQAGLKSVLFETGGTAGADFDLVKTMNANLDRLSTVL